MFLENQNTGQLFVKCHIAIDFNYSDTSQITMGFKEVLK